MLVITCTGAAYPMPAEHEAHKINLTRVPLAFARGGILIKGARWNNQEILEAGTEITEQVIADYQDIALYMTVSLRGQPTASATEAMVRRNIDDYYARLKADKVRDISQEYGRGEVIFEQGDESNQDCFFLIEGSVDVLIAGQKVATITEPGQPIGEMSFLSDEARSATIRAAEPAKLLRIPKKDKRFLLRTNPTIVATLMDALVKRLKDTSNRLSEVQARLEEAEAVRAEAALMRSELERLTRNSRILAQHTEKEVGMRSGNYRILVALLEHLRSAEPDDKTGGNLDFSLLDGYIAYLESQGISKVASPITDTEAMPEALRMIIDNLDKKGST